MENKKLIAENIRNIRNILKMKQKELAKNLGISSGYLSEIEAAKKSPGIEVVEKFLKKYKVNPAYLLTGEGDCFLTADEKAKPAEQKIKTKDSKTDPYHAAITEMLWYFDHIPFVGFAMLEFFNNYLHEKKDRIEEEIKKIKEKNPEEEIPER